MCYSHSEVCNSGNMVPKPLCQIIIYTMMIIITGGKLGHCLDCKSDNVCMDFKFPFEIFSQWNKNKQKLKAPISDNLPNLDYNPLYPLKWAKMVELNSNLFCS